MWWPSIPVMVTRTYSIFSLIEMAYDEMKVRSST